MGHNDRFATRFLLPMELAFGWTGIGWAIAGVFGSGVFAQTLEHAGLGTPWLLMVFAWGIGTLLTCTIELLCGWTWDDARLHRSCLLRSYLAWFGLVLWAILGLLMIDAAILRSTLSINWSLPMYLVGCSAAWVLDRRTAALLDPNAPTERLREKLVRERNARWIR